MLVKKLFSNIMLLLNQENKNLDEVRVLTSCYEIKAIKFINTIKSAANSNNEVGR